MSKESATLYRRVNITLPENTLRLIDRAAKKGDKSRLVDKAVQYFLRDLSRVELNRRLKEGARRRSARDRCLSEEWFLLEEGAWKNVRK